MTGKGGRANTVEPIMDPGNLAPDELSTNQEAKPIPYMAGQVKVAVRWVGPAYDQFTQPVPSGGKKGGKGGKGGGGGGVQLKNYYGSLGGVVCNGPVDELMALIVDGNVVWPTLEFWADGVDALQVVQYTRTAGIATVLLAQVPELYGSNQIVVSGMDDGSFNLGAATACSWVYGAFVAYPSAGPDVAWTLATGGTLTKVLNVVLNAVMSRNGTVYQCILAHSGLPATAPPNGVYWKLFTVSRAGNPNPYPLSVVNYGAAYFYWGASDQTLRINGVLRKYGHPPYRNQALIELEGFLFGTERTTAPNIEVVVGRAPQQTIIVDGSQNLDADHQANPAAVALELLTNPLFGLGLPAGLFDATTWTALADALAAAADKTYLSPLLERATAARSLLTELLGYFDGWARWNGSGLLEAGMFSHNAAPPGFTADTTINYNDLIEEIQFDSQGWASTSNETLVTFADRIRGWKDGAALDRNGWNRQLVGEPRRNSLERLWITRRAQAVAYAAEYGKIYAQQKVTGSLVVRAEKATAIREGDLFLLTHDNLSFSVVCRCTEKTLPAAPSGRANITFEMERGIAPLPYHATPAAPGGTSWPPPEAIQLYQFVQPPPALAAGSDFEIAVLAARVVPTTYGLRLWLKKDDAALYYDLGEQKRWAVTGTLAQNYAANLPADTVEPPDDTTETLQLNLSQYTVPADLASVSDTQTADAINDNNLLVWVFQAGAPTHFEIMTVIALRLDAGVYKLKVRRGRFGTTKRAFNAGDTAFILHREDLVTYSHNNFAGYVASGTAATFGLQSFTAAAEGDTSDPNQFTLVNWNFTDPYAPVGTWLALQKKAAGDSDFADIADFSVTFDPSTQFRFSYQMTDGNSDLVSGTLVARLGSVEQTLWSQKFAATGMLSKSTIFTLGIGNWTVVLILADATGRTKECPLTPVGGGAAVLLNVNVAAPTQCSTPIANPPGGSYLTGNYAVTLTDYTPGATLYYSLVALGAAPGVWTAVVGAINVGVSRILQKTLWSKATKAGLTDSQLGRDDYTWESGS